MIIQAIKTSVMKFIEDEEGLTTVEYAVAGSLVALAVVISFTSLGEAVAASIDALTAVISPATP
jgi:pilus assembly protein Flp/PilA